MEEDPELLPPVVSIRVEFEQPLPSSFSSVRSPKAIAFPVVAMVIKSIIFDDDGVLPPTQTPLVAFDAPDTKSLAVVASPKSCVFPVVAICRN